MPAIFKSRKVAKSASLAKRKNIEEGDEVERATIGSESPKLSKESDIDDEHLIPSILERNKKRTKLGGSSVTTATTAIPSVNKVDVGEVKYDHTHTTKASNWAADEATKQSALYSSELDDSTESLPKGNPEESIDGLYHGKVNYSSYLTKREGAARFGPLKASGNIRSTTMVDYQPDVCKDYKQTGYCGYGDSCKFLHSREDYKAGWKLDKDWEEVQNQSKSKSLTDSSAADTKDSQPEIPFKCVICKNDYKEPVVTQCEHYFCESCFLKEYRRKGGCFICGKNTGGIAKPAKNLKKLLAQRVE